MYIFLVSYSSSPYHDVQKGDEDQIRKDDQHKEDLAARNAINHRSVKIEKKTKKNSMSTAVIHTDAQL